MLELNNVLICFDNDYLRHLANKNVQVCWFQILQKLHLSVFCLYFVQDHVCEWVRPCVFDLNVLTRVSVCVSSSLLSPGYGDTLCVAVLRADGFLQLIQLPGLLQLLHQALDRFLTPLLLLTSSVLLPYSSDASSCSSAPCRSLLPSQEALHYWGSEGKDGGHGGFGMYVCVS